MRCVWCGVWYDVCCVCRVCVVLCGARYVVYAVGHVRVVVIVVWVMCMMSHAA